MLTQTQHNTTQHNINASLNLSLSALSPPPSFSRPNSKDMPVQSMICRPSAGDTLKLQGTKDHPTVKVKGFAWGGGGSGINRVDVSTDGGKTFTRANLIEKPIKERRGAGEALAFVIISNMCFFCRRQNSQRFDSQPLTRSSQTLQSGRGNSLKRRSLYRQNKRRKYAEAKRSS